MPAAFLCMDAFYRLLVFRMNDALMPRRCLDPKGEVRIMKLERILYAAQVLWDNITNPVWVLCHK